jgi:hypothetical protein
MGDFRCKKGVSLRLLKTYCNIPGDSEDVIAALRGKANGRSHRNYYQKEAYFYSRRSHGIS